MDMTDFGENCSGLGSNEVNLRIVVVGGGLVGCKFAEEMSSLLPDARLIVIGDEPLYDRTQLVKLIDGRLPVDAIMLNCEVLSGQVTGVDREYRVVHYTSKGNVCSLGYDVLVLATGSKVFVPSFPGSHGCVALRNIADVQRIKEKQPSSAVIVGAGVLGVEIAHALNNQGCKVSVIDISERLMERQLDVRMSHHLQRVMEQEGIAFYLGSSVSKTGKGYVETVQRRVSAELVILAAGVVPNDGLARKIGLSCDQGVIVDKDMRSSDPNIFAVGDCCHGSSGQVHPGYEQARVAAREIAGLEHTEVQSIPATRLKTHHKLFAMGRFLGKPVCYKSDQRIRTIWLDDDRIIGAVVWGEWDNLSILQNAINSGDKLSKWRQVIFWFAGDPWSFTAQDLSHWPASRIVCQCRGVNLGALTQAIDDGADTVQAIGEQTGAGTGCGSCKPLLTQLLAVAPEPVKYHKGLGIAAIVSSLMALSLVSYSIPYPETFVESWSFIWRDFFVKQMSGYTLLVIGLLLAAISIRKRVRIIDAGNFDIWRMLHTVLGLFALLGIFVHSGGRFGDGIVFLLSVSWLLTAMVGSALSAIASRSHTMRSSVREPLRKTVHWSHTLFLWPLPLLLFYHVAGVYLWH